MLWHRLAMVATATIAAYGLEPGYVDPLVCAACHAKAAESYARSAMARSFGVTVDAPTGSFHHDKTAQDFTIRKRDGKMYLQRSVEGLPETYEAEMSYRIGSGEHAQSYASRGANGKLTELPLTWYPADGGHWGMSPGYDLPFHAGFSRRITYGCLFCHAGYPDLPREGRQEPAGWKMPEKMPEGIDCQRCHGPGAAHVEAARAGQNVARVRSLMVNPAKLDAARGMEVCLQCHLETTTLRLPASIVKYDRPVFSYRAGEPLADYVMHFDTKADAAEHPLEFAGEAYRMRQSACFLKSGGKLTCLTCHNPHDIPRGAEATRRYNGICQTCHAPTVSSHMAGGDCVACHMLKRRPADALNTIVSDHWIQKRPAAEPAGERVERNDSTVAPYRGEVIPYYPSRVSDLYLADAQVKNRANTAAGAAKLGALLKQNPSAAGEFYLDLAESTRSPEYARKATETMPRNWRAWMLLGTLTDSIEALQKAAALAPEEPSAAQALGEMYAKQSRFDEALAAFRTAVQADPEFAEGHNNIGTALLRRGDTAGAEKELRAAVRLRPESSAMQVNLASLLARNGQLAEARKRFDVALKLNPEYAEGHAAYGAALAQAREWSGARTELEKALKLNAKLPVAHHNLGVVLVQSGDPDAAMTQFQSAVDLDPTYYEAHLELGLLLKRAGRKNEAEAHLREALESPAPRVKQSAAQALNNQ